MNNLTTVSNPIACKVEELSLTDALDLLLRHGHPKLGHYDKGWYCGTDMFVSSKGVDFKISSDFGCPSAEIAARSCLTRLLAALETLNNA